MCGGPEQSNASSGDSCQRGGISGFKGDSSSGVVDMTETLDGDSTDAVSCLLELAASNDLAGFKGLIEEGKAKVDSAGNWYCRHNGMSQMVLEKRTPAMIAALYGSLDVLKYILSTYGAHGGDVDQACGTDGSTVLHCAAAGGSARAVEAVKLLLEFGADLNVLDAQERRPADVIGVSPRLAHVKVELEKILKGTKPIQSVPVNVPVGLQAGLPFFAEDLEEGCLLSAFESANGFDGMDIGAGIAESSILSPSCSPSISSGKSGLSPFASPSPSSSPKSPDSPAKIFGETTEKVREYPIDPSLPDIKNSIYMTDEFRMFSFKVRPCSRAYSHDWTECPFVHPGENARRRDPRRYHYSCVPCPDFRKGACRRGDTCEYAHGVFECWLHPAQYRTRLCKDGTDCSRRVCFFAHTNEELRPLYVSTGSAVPSPRIMASSDMPAMSPTFAPGSPSSILMMPPFSPSNPVQSPTQASLATPPMSPLSPSANSLSGTWSQPNVPALHLPGVSLQASRLRSALNARDVALEDFIRSSDYDGPSFNEFASLSSQALSTQARLNAAVAASTCGNTSSRGGKYRSAGITVAPMNLDELFLSEMVSSPRSVMHDSALLCQVETQMKSHSPAHLQSQLHSQLEAQISSPVFPRVSAEMQLQLQQMALDSQIQGSSLVPSPTHKSSLLQSPQVSSFSLGSLRRLSTHGGLDGDRHGSTEASLSPAILAARAAFAQRDKRSHSSRDLGTGLSCSDWGSPTGKPEWGVQGYDLSKLRKSASFGFRGSEEPDMSWVQKLVKEGPLEADAAVAPNIWAGDGASIGQREGADHSVLGSWIDKLQLDEVVA